MSRKQVIGVFCTDSDLQDSTVIMLATKLGIISKEDIKEDGSVDYTEEQTQDVLKILFGFYKGYYEKEFMSVQRTRIGNKTVKDSYRYIGTERQDKDWVESSMCSQETREIVKWGTVL